MNASWRIPEPEKTPLYFAIRACRSMEALEAYRAEAKACHPPGYLPMINVWHSMRIILSEPNLKNNQKKG